MGRMAKQDHGLCSFAEDKRRNISENESTRVGFIVVQRNLI